MNRTDEAVQSVPAEPRPPVDVGLEQATGEAEQLAAYRRVRDAIRARIEEELLAEGR